MFVRRRRAVRRLTAGFLALLMLCSSVGCVTVVPAEPAMTFEEFLVRVNARKEAFCTAALPDISAYTPGLHGREYIISAEEMELLTTPKDPSRVTAEEARRDVDLAFRLLKHSYVAYDYFGGDKVFYAARKEILDALPDEGEVFFTQLKRAFIDVLSPILQDRHFRIEGKALPSCTELQCWYVPGLYFNDETAVEDAVAEHVRLTVDGAGRLRFCLAAYVTAEEAEALPESAVIGGETVRLRWKQDRPSVFQVASVFEETTLEENIPFLTVTSFKDEEEEQKQQLERFVESGTTYARAPLLVMDLRGNGGGFTSYCSDWFENYTGEVFEYPMVWVMKYSKLNVYAIRRAGQERLLDTDVPAGTWERITRDNRWHYTPREGITFLLTDRETASAAERMLINALSLENAVTLGGFSMGCYLVSNNLYFYLPYSGLQIRLGTALTLVGNLGNFDGVGIEPDIWTPAGDAADAVCRLVAYYDLNDLDDLDG